MCIHKHSRAGRTVKALLGVTLAAWPVLAAGSENSPSGGVLLAASDGGSAPYVIPMAGDGTPKSEPFVIPMAGDTPQTEENAETAGTLCTGEDWVVFSGVSTRTGKVVSVCLEEGDDSTPSHLTYRFGDPGDVEMRFPDHAEGSFDAFTLRRYTRPRTTYLKFEFTTGGYQYAILDGSDAEAAQQEPPELRVTRLSDGVVVARHDLAPTTGPLSLMQLETLVRSAPFDE